MPQTPAQIQETATNVKELLESILVAFILAFIFRCFVVEAFVIPTGSMAPTLMGAHARWKCPDCGYEFDTNFNPRGQGDDLEVPTQADHFTYNIHCPNCGYKFTHDQATAPALYFGDRILVLKYQPLQPPPRRWDVVVFKAPVTPSMGPPTGKPDDYSQNFIKRLIGLPGESVMVLDGEIFVKPAGASQFAIQAKPRAAQEALWRGVFDNDHLPRGLPRTDQIPFVEPWRAEMGTWNTSGRIFTFDSTGSNQDARLQFDPSANPSTHALTDTVGYDQTRTQDRPDDFTDEDDVLDRQAQRFTVTDVKLDLFYERQSGDGPFSLHLSKFDDYFTARFTPTTVTLVRQNARMNEPQTIAQATLPSAGGPLHIEFSNSDYRVIVRVNDQDLIVSTPEQYHPDVEALRQRILKVRKTFTPYEQWDPKPQIAIEASSQQCRVSHIRLLRSVYYTPIDSGNLQPLVTGDIEPGHEAVLGPGEFFVMGDNSSLSYDARFWPYPVNLEQDEDLTAAPGRVPERFMIGRAFMVYWPAGFRPLDLSYGIIPNFGEMRFIH